MLYKDIIGVYCENLRTRKYTLQVFHVKARATYKNQYALKLNNENTSPINATENLLLFMK
jgi:hypothetical protein